MKPTNDNGAHSFTEGMNYTSEPEKTESMEKKYEYKLRDEKYLLAIKMMIDNIYFNYQGQNIDGITSIRTINYLNRLNVLDLFFDKVEVKELPIVGSRKVYIENDEVIIDRYNIHRSVFDDMYIKSFTLINGTHVSESDVKQIREYLNK